MMDKSPRRAILVLGMHRSGTSALTRVVNLLGATLPSDLYPPDAQNPAGYWESQYLVGLNEWILEAAGATWSNCLGFAPEQLAGPGLVGIMGSLVEGTRRVFGDATLFVMKDPRLCLLLEFWLPALRSLGIEVSVLLVVRSPVAVAQSLLQRNGFPLPEGVALWLRYVLAAEYGSRSVPRAVLSYDALMADWQATMRRAGEAIGVDWPHDSARVATEVARFLRPDLRHYDDGVVVDSVPWQIRTWAEEGFAALQAQAGDAPGGQFLTTLDRLRSEVTAWCQRAVG